jgi:death on curing protein
VSRRYLTLGQIVLFHRELIDRFGGLHGMRDQAALESALARPQTGYYADVIEEASALWESISQNHPFIDGNKRIAITAAVFLRINGYYLVIDDEEAYKWVLERYQTGTFRKTVLETWLRGHVTPTGAG